MRIFSHFKNVNFCLQFKNKRTKSDLNGSKVIWGDDLKFDLSNSMLGNKKSSHFVSPATGFERIACTRFDFSYLFRSERSNEILFECYNCSFVFLLNGLKVENSIFVNQVLHLNRLTRVYEESKFVPGVFRIEIRFIGAH